MATVVSMLNSEIVNLPPPSYPAFIEREIVSCAESSQQNHRTYSINIVTVTDMQDLKGVTILNLVLTKGTIHFLKCSRSVLVHMSQVHQIHLLMDNLGGLSYPLVSDHYHITTYPNLGRPPSLDEQGIPSPLVHSNNSTL
ncbi:G-type lectin S-receptor-like serine/threonine-protein kinase, partial [Mucuna pruriens]